MIEATVFPDHIRDADLALAIAARAVASAATAGSGIAGLVEPPCAPFFENAAIMMRASRFIVSISAGGNSETPPLVADGTERGELGSEIGCGSGEAPRAGVGEAAATDGRGIFRFCACLA